MRLRSWTIESGGELPRVDSGDLPNGLVVVFSHDPARKESALSTLRRILFATSDSEPARACASARISGPHGEFELSTNGAPDSESLRRVGGDFADDNDLRRLFGRAERSDLRPVFDLVACNGHSGILDTGSMPSSPAMDLHGEMERILGDDGDGALDALLAELAQIQARLDAATLRDSVYDDDVARERSATNEVGQLCADLAELRRRRERLKVYAALWPAWVNRAQPERDLAALEAIDQFPDTDVDIVEAQRSAHDADDHLQEIRKLHRQARAEFEVMPPEGDRHTVADRVDAICRELPIYRQRMTTYARARARRDDLQAQRRSLRHDVAGDHGEPVFDPSDLDLDAAREWLARAQASAEREATTRAEIEQARSALKQLRSERQRAVRAAKSLRGHLEDSDEHWRAIWSLRDDLEELWEVQSQGEAAARTAEQRLEAIEGLEVAAAPTGPSRWSAFLWFISASAFVLALWSAGREDSTMAQVLCATALGAAVIDLAMASYRRSTQQRNRALSGKENRLRHELDRARQLRDERWHTADEIARRVESAACALGLSPMPSLEEVNSAEERLFQASRMLHTRGPLAETALAIHRFRDEEEALMARQRQIRQSKDAVALEWDEWKSTVGLPRNLGQEDLTAYLFEHDRWRELETETRRVDEQLRDLSPAIEAWEARARGLLTEIGVDCSPQLCGRDLEDQVTTLRENAHRSRRLLARRAELRERVDQLDRDLAEAQQQADDRRALFDDVRRQAGTDDAVEYERRRQVFRQRRATAATLQRCEDEFTRQLAEHRMADSSDVRADLANGSADKWLEMSHETDAEIERLESRMAAVSHERALAAAECRRIEESSEVEALRQEFACLSEEIRRCAARWRTLALADALIALASRDSAASGGMLDEASTSLRSLTCGAFSRFAVPPDGEGLIVVDRAGEPHTVDGRLPEGLNRQIEFSLRLGRVREVARESGAIPVVMDEILRDLGDEQAAATAGEIARLAAEQQVFYFTTDPASIEALERAGDVSRVLRL